ncbi:aldehyde dehydrogenase family protein [Tunturiibacter gelidiferens]
MHLCRRPLPPARRPHRPFRALQTPHDGDLAPLGVVGIISAFNFPVAVWSWNAALALVSGDAVVWKPSEKTPLTALATQAIFERAAKSSAAFPRPRNSAHRRRQGRRAASRQPTHPVGLRHRINRHGPRRSA